jgi:hypothetical protein
MYLVWNDKDSFRRHLKDMQNFRQSHGKRRAEERESYKDMPVLGARPPREKGLVKNITEIQNSTIPYLVQKIYLAKGIQN